MNRSLGKPEFATTNGLFIAGTAFVLFVHEIQAMALVTCQHLFGPAGGLDVVVASDLMPSFVTAVRLWDPFDGKELGVAGGAIGVPGADADDPMRDLAVFAIPTNHGFSPFDLAERDSTRGERLFLAGRPRAGAAINERFHSATCHGLGEDGTLLLQVDNVALDLGGMSGGPVLNQAGEVVGILVRYIDDPTLLAMALPASAMRGLLLDAARRGA